MEDFMLQINPCDSRIVEMRRQIDEVLKREGIIGSHIGLQSRLYTDTLWCVSMELRDDEIQTGITEIIEGALSKILAPPFRLVLTRTLIPIITACRDGFKEKKQ